MRQIILADSDERDVGPRLGEGVSCGAGSGGEHDLDGSAFVHRRVAVGGPVQRQCEVEDPAGVDLPVPDALDEVGQIAADGCINLTVS